MLLLRGAARAKRKRIVLRQPSATEKAAIRKTRFKSGGRILTQ